MSRPTDADLTIVIVSWNTEPMLRDCLESVQSHTGSLSVEIIVVDNASTDGSAEMVASEFPTVCLLRNERNVGFAQACNQAMRRARGRYVLLLNSDTVVLGDVLRSSVQFMDAHDGVGVLGCRVLNPDRSVQRTCFGYPTLLNLFLMATGLHRLPWPRFFGRYQMRRWQRDTEREVDVVSGCFMVVRQAAIDDVGLLDESFFFYAEETDWCLRIRRAGWSVRFAPVGEIIHYGGASAVQLWEHRGLLLAEALIHLHRKHGGPVAAWLARQLLWSYFASRALAYTAAASVTRRWDLCEHAAWLRAVTRGFAGALRRTGQADGNPGPENGPPAGGMPGRGRTLGQWLRRPGPGLAISRRSARLGRSGAGTPRAPGPPQSR